MTTRATPLRLPGGSWDRLVALSRTHGLSDTATSRLAALLLSLAEDPHAPTAARDPLRAVDEHVADSLVALQLEQTRSAATIADLGSGAGFPGLPLAVALPRASVALVESSARKCAFLRRVAGAVGADNARVVHTRAEGWSQALGRLDLVVARALAPLPVVAEYAAPLLRIGGALLVWRGRIDPEVEAATRRAGAELGLEVLSPQPVWPFPTAAHRHLQLMLKVRSTPDRFPRRPGMARKRPLAA